MSGDTFLDDIEFELSPLPEEAPVEHTTRVEKPAPTRKPGDTWKPVDLAAVLAAGYEPPKPTICRVEGSEFALFYPGRISALFGDSGGGKSWVSLFTLAQEMNAGNDVVLVDYEDHPAAAVDRLEKLGVDRATILRHLLYFQPQERWDRKAEDNLAAALAGRHITATVIDSTGEGMALDGVNPNADDEVARWFRGAARFLSALGSAVILIDHVPKGVGGQRNTDFSIGSQRKRAAINGAAYFLDVKQAPSRDEDGEFELITRKCRFGWRKHGTIACTVRMLNNPDGTIDFIVEQPEQKQPAVFRPTWYMERLSIWLEEMGQPVSWRAARSAPVGKAGGKADRKAVDKALATLRDEGYISWPKTQPLEHVKPYRQADDPAVENSNRGSVAAAGDPF